MRFDLGGQTYEFDEGHVAFAEFRYVKRELGLSSSDFIVGLPHLDVEALGAAVLLTMRRRSVSDPSAPVFTTADLDKLDMVELIESVARHAQADAAALAAPPAEPAPDPAEPEAAATG